MSTVPTSTLKQSLDNIKNKAFPFKSFAKSQFGMDILSNTATVLSDRLTDELVVAELVAYLDKSTPAIYTDTELPKELWANGQVGIPRLKEWLAFRKRKIPALSKATSQFRDMHADLMLRFDDPQQLASGSLLTACLTPFVTASYVMFDATRTVLAGDVRNERCI